MAQHFKLISDTPQRLEFKSGGVKWLALIFGLVGLPILCVGLYSLLFPGEGVEEAGTALILTGFGLSFSSVISLAFMKDNNPSHIVFDHENGGVEVKNSKSSAWIPYTEIKEFGVSIFTTSSSSGSTRTSNTNYQVYWQKHDGGRWDLAHYSRRDKAERLKEKLEKEIDITKKSSREFAPTLPLSIHKKILRGHDTFEWSNGAEGSIFLGLGVVIGFLLIGIGWIQNTQAYEDESGIGGWLFTLFAGGILITMVFGMISGVTTKNAIRITNNNLEMLKIKGGRDKVLKEIPLSEIRSIYFDLDKTHGGNMLKIATQEDHERIMSVSQRGMSLQSVGDLIALARDQKVIKINLSAIDRLHFEYVLQETIKSKGGYEVL